MMGAGSRFAQVRGWIGGHPFAVIAPLLLGQAVLLSLIRTGTTFDGAEQLLYTQYLDLGYGRSQPPLYTWLLIGTQQVLGVGQLAENLLRAVLTLAGLAGIHSLTRRLGFGLGVTAAVTFAFFLVPEISVEIPRKYSHSVLLFALMPLTLLLYLRLVSGRKTADYAAFGLALAALVLCKYNALVMVVALVAADLIVLRGKAAFADRRSLIAVGVALLLLAPHLVWAASHINHVTALTTRFEMDPAAGFPAAQAKGIVAFLGALASLVMLLSGIAVAIARRQTLQLFVAPPHDLRRVLLVCAGLYLALTVVMVLVSSATNVAARWLLPVTVPLLPVVLGQLCELQPKAARALNIAAGVVLALTVPGQWVHSAFVGNQTHWDYARLASDVDRVASPTKLLIDDFPILANLRLQRPDIAFDSPVMPYTLPDHDTRPVLLWTGKKKTDLLDWAASRGYCPDGTPAQSVTVPSVYTDETLTVGVMPLRPCSGT